jgi:hypothetical protein
VVDNDEFGGIREVVGKIEVAGKHCCVVAERNG